ncbi:hypothetical protein MIZ03_2090 [Rhodoferax lithotrophicus]|uniref:Uncharacterized protein n=1 Tax=Rhodoferax lithotrophicus TaxID=2798804 RepID=A0ABM7MLQ3_9BURK|nr:hypothetical protein MIZ03_2090 [Rhodoferax sp. MIZ03]
MTAQSHLTARKSNRPAPMTTTARFEMPHKAIQNIATYAGK